MGAEDKSTTEGVAARDRDRKSSQMRIAVLIAITIFVPLVIAASVYTALRRPAPLPVTREGLIAYWAFHSDLGGRAIDSIGKHNGRIYSPKWVTGRGYLALQLDGQAAYITVPHATGLATAIQSSFTIAAWVKLAPGAQRRRQVLLHTVGPGGELRLAPVTFYVPWGEGRLGLVLSDGQRRVGFLSDRPISGNRWHHVAVTFSFDDQAGTGRIRFYIDGELVGERVTTVQPRSTDVGTLLIGAARTGATRRFYFQGELDSLSLYDRALTPQEVRALAAPG